MWKEDSSGEMIPLSFGVTLDCCASETFLRSVTCVAPAAAAVYPVYVLFAFDDVRIPPCPSVCLCTMFIDRENKFKFDCVMHV